MMNMCHLVKSWPFVQKIGCRQGHFLESYVPNDLKKRSRLPKSNFIKVFFIEIYGSGDSENQVKAMKI